MNQPLVSVVIPNYNYGRFLSKTIESVLAQTYPNIEIIVVDDGSTDDSIKIIESFGDQVKLIKQQNQGVGMARNTGTENSKGDVLTFLDADDYWHQDKIKKQIEKLQSDSEIGLVHCGFWHVDIDDKLLDQRIEGEEGWVADKLMKLEPVLTSTTLLVWRDVFMEVGGYDTNRNLHPAEDWEFSYRVARKYKFGFVAEPLVYYRQHGKGGHTNLLRMEKALILGLDKIFKDYSGKISRKTCYGNLFTMLSGSYFYAGDYRRSAVCGVKSLLSKPVNVFKFMSVPVKLLSNKIRSS